MSKPTDKPIKQASKLQQRKNRQSNRGSGIVSDWQNANADKVLELIAVASNLQMSISFSYTEKEGAYCIAFYEWATRETIREYCRPTEDVDMFINNLIEWLKS